MNVDRPIANRAWGPLLIRLLLGGYFVMAGLAKLEDPGAFVEVVKGYAIVPAAVATVYAVILPYVEVGAGAALIIGFWTTIGAMAASVLLLTFIYAFGLFANYPFNKDLVLLAASLSLLCTGAGSISIDGIRGEAK